MKDIDAFQLIVLVSGAIRLVWLAFQIPNNWKFPMPYHSEERRLRSLHLLDLSIAWLALLVIFTLTKEVTIAHFF